MKDKNKSICEFRSQAKGFYNILLKALNKAGWTLRYDPTRSSLERVSVCKNEDQRRKCFYNNLYLDNLGISREIEKALDF